jgi:hypothetical protein
MKFFLFRILFATAIFATFFVYLNPMSPNSNPFGIITPSSLTFGDQVPIQSELNENNYYINSSESIRRNYPESSTNSTSFILETPQEYEYGDFSFLLSVESAIVEAIIEENQNSAISKLEVAQKFNISQGYYLDSLWLYFGTADKASSNINLQIRNATYDGEIIYTKSFTTSDGWTQIKISDLHIISQGIYFIYLPSINPSQKQWFRSASGNNDTETWINDKGWKLANYDMTLKVHTREIITPEDVDLTINDYPVINTADNRGVVSFSQIIGDQPQTFFNVNASSMIKLNYTCEAQFFRNSSHVISQKLINTDVEGRINLSLAEYPAPYSQYQVNLTGFLEDYDKITPMKGMNVVGFVKLAPGVIKLMQAPDYIVFSSPNYITSLIAPPTVYSGETLDIMFNIISPGQVQIELWNNNTLINSTQGFFNTTDSYRWTIDPTFDAGRYEIKLTYMSPTHLGFKNTSFTVIKEAYLEMSPISVDALEKVSIDCLFKDKILESSLCDAEIGYNINDIQGKLVSNEICIYSTTIDLNRFALTPGSYEFNIIAQKEGYRTIASKVPLIINHRNVSVTFSQTATNLKPGDNMTFQISLSDAKTNNALIRPVDVKVSLMGKTTNGTSYEMMSAWVYSCVRNCDIDWSVPREVEAGNYDIVIEVYSEFYKGTFHKESGIIIYYPPKSYTPLIFGAILIGGFSSTIAFIERKKINAKRSLGGVLLVHEQGTPLADIISEEYAMGDPILIAGAVMGMVTLIREITGKGLHTMQIEGGYVNLIKCRNYWIVLFMRENPWWITRDIMKMVQDIDKNFGKAVLEFTGKLPDINLNPIIKSYFGKYSHLIQKMHKIEANRIKYATAADISQK